MKLKERFIEEVKAVGTPQIISVAVKLPNGAVEVITNTQETVSKVDYYINTYDDEFRLKHNNAIQIVGYMIV
ncbi:MULTISPECIES: hypothetical protein [Bacillus]|uniref:Uncharacterized protein n=2 Tax=Bacillus cereus group TaxID=86661 RepID=A0A9X6ZWI8_BACCE|nr:MULTISPECIES: hypothetical protein [Bacillus cereus group]MBY0036676.1 hypothetical protein [Bacillus cereus]MEB8714939.1 hypothetical protein [Bacillus cereus]MEB9431725.1 hypothetical protein [Bacillus cereus]MEB9479886.1 hypothetical protein [Bacillus cereus]MEB9590266.1 hypothetical protein [Bacillus cereus]